MGRLLALALARRGHGIAVYDAHGPEGDGAAARVAAAMLAPLAESAITEPGVVRMGQHGLTRWPELLAQLDAPVFFQQNGTLILWHRQDAGDAQRFFGLLEKNRRINPSLPALQPLAEDETRAALRREADRRGNLLPDEVIAHLLTRHERDMVHLMAVLDRLDGFSLAEKRHITVPLLKKMLAENAATPSPAP